MSVGNQKRGLGKDAHRAVRTRHGVASRSAWASLSLSPPYRSKTSWPGLSRPSTSLFKVEDVDARHRGRA